MLIHFSKLINLLVPDVLLTKVMEPLIAKVRNEVLPFNHLGAPIGARSSLTSFISVLLGHTVPRP